MAQMLRAYGRKSNTLTAIQAFSIGKAHTFKMVPQMVPQRSGKILVDSTEGVAMQQHGKTQNNSEDPAPMKSRKKKRQHCQAITTY